MATTAEPVEGGYVLNGTKLWATNGAIADVVVVMARVPKSEGHKGGISAFVLDYTSEGVTVMHRNAFMGLKRDRELGHRRSRTSSCRRRT